MQMHDVLNDYQAAHFTGEWKFNQRNGKGNMSWPDGSKFEGEWLNDQRVKGKLVMPDHNVYEGEFRNDKFHGVGKINYTREGLSFECIY
jgi:hypothetical protein